jgi:hypothetical protein
LTIQQVLDIYEHRGETPLPETPSEEAERILSSLKAISETVEKSPANVRLKRFDASPPLSNHFLHNSSLPVEVRQVICNKYTCAILYLTGSDYSSESLQLLSSYWDVPRHPKKQGYLRPITNAPRPHSPLSSRRR